MSEYDKIGGFNNNPFPKLISQAKGYFFGAGSAQAGTPQKVIKSRKTYRKVVKPAAPKPQLQYDTKPKANKPWYQEIFD